jgi:hypothetical protein
VSRRVSGRPNLNGPAPSPSGPEAGAFILALPEGFKERNSWQRATELLMEAALHEGDINVATEAIERAGFMQFMWMPRTR